MEEKTVQQDQEGKEEEGNEHVSRGRPRNIVA